MEARSGSFIPEEGLTSAGKEAPLQLLIDTGLLLASERSLDVIVQAALDAGLKLSGARFGAFFYNRTSDEGEDYPLFKVSGVPAAAFASFPHPRPTDLFVETFKGRGIVRSADITKDFRYGRNAPLSGMPPGHLPVRSYLAVPVSSRGGEVLGAMLYGHPEPDIFPQESESLVATVAAQAAVAMENARLAEGLSREIALADQARTLQRDTADRLRQALDAGQLGTWSWDKATDLLDLDERAAELYGTAPNVPISRTVLRERVVTADDLALTAENLYDAMGEVAYQAEYRIDIDGHQRWVASRGLTIYTDDTHEAIGMIGTVQDVTARKTQEATLRQSEKLAATGRLAATIAHEINNPLEAVTNLIYLCKTDPTVPTPIQRLLDTADGELARVAQIAQQTLGFYRDTSHPTEINLTELLEGVADLFSRKLQARSLKFNLELSPDLQIFGLHGEIRQVFSNLIVNAIDASVQGEIRVRARPQLYKGVEGVSVLISDQGSGIPANIRSRLFSPFFTTKESIGTGLGLWVTRGIVEKVGGVVSFRSCTEPPTGTVFRVFLPTGNRPSALFFSRNSNVLQ